jgi:hypothetical protein
MAGHHGIWQKQCFWYHAQGMTDGGFMLTDRRAKADQARRALAAART